MTQRTDGAPSFRYEKLEFADSIRVLELLPSRDDDARITFRFLHVRLGDDPSFEAISYVWGEPVFSNKIWDAETNAPIAITENLHDAFTAMRMPDKSRYVWADAVCIEQTNPDEKGHQVANMGQVYSEADGVVVWLGRDPMDDAFESIEAFAAESAKLGFPFPSGIYFGMEPVDRIERVRRWARGFGDDAKHFKEAVNVGAMERFLGHAWFTRLWTVQEFVLARKVVFLSGQRELGYEDLGRMVELWNYLGVFTFLPGSSFLWGSKGSPLDQALTILRYRNSHREPGYANPSATCFNMIQKRCMDDRDRVYALLSLTPPLRFMKPSYRIDTDELYYEYTRALLSFGDPHALHLAGIEFGASKPRQGSWIVDWRRSDFPSYSLWGMNMSGCSASGDSSAELEFLHPRHRWVSVKGLRQDEISLVEDLMDKPDPDEQELQGETFGRVFHRLQMALECLCLRKGADRRAKVEEFFAAASAGHGTEKVELIISIYGLCQSTTQDSDGIYTDLEAATAELQRLATWLGVDDLEDFYKTLYLPGQSRERKGMGASSKASPEGVGALSLCRTFFQRNLEHRILFVTKGGRMGLGRRAVQPGDIVVTFNGFATPFIVREADITVPERFSDRGQPCGSSGRHMCTE